MLKILDITNLRPIYIYIYYKFEFRISALKLNLYFSHYVSAQKWIECNKVVQIDQIGAKWTGQDQSGRNKT